MQQRLQAIQNAAACLITDTQRCEYITPVFQRLPWFPVVNYTGFQYMQQPVKFKLAVLVYKVLNNLAPPHLSDDCQLIATTWCRLGFGNAQFRQKT